MPPTESRPWTEIVLPSDLTRIHSMLSDEERQYLIWLASEEYKGAGAIVELGVWLGSSSASLAEGLRRAGSKTIIHSFDLFRWEPYMAEFPGAPQLQPGDDFLPAFLDETREYAGWIRPSKVDLLNCSWNGGPIEILFVDSAKTWDVTNAVLKSFGPYLIPGRSRVVLQDFTYHYAHCLPLIFDSRPDVWKELERVDSGHTVSFMPLKTLFGPSGIEANYSEESFPWISAEHLLKSRIAREAGGSRFRMTSSLYRKALIDGPIEEAQSLRKELVRQGIDEAELRIAENIEPIILQRGWAAFDGGDFETARQCAERLLNLMPQRSIHALNLMAFAMLRLGDRQSAERWNAEVLSLNPQFPPARMLRIESAIRDGQYQAAQTQILDVLRIQPLDETTIQWALNFYDEADQLQTATTFPFGAFREIAEALQGSPNFLVFLAQKQFQANRRPEAIANIERALQLNPDHTVATRLRADWD